MIDYGEENDKDIFGGLDDEDVEADRESRQCVFQFNNNCPSAPIPNDFSQSKNGEKEKVNIQHKRMVKTFIDEYISEDKQHYIICIEEGKNEIIIFISNKEKDSLFFSKYKINYLNEKFNFKNIQEFKMLLKINVQKKLLSIREAYKNAINTIWKLYPNDPKDIQTFSLISDQNWEKNLSFYFYSNFKREEKVVKEINEQFKMKPSQENKENSFEGKAYKKLDFLQNDEANIFEDDNNDDKLDSKFSIFQFNPKDNNCPPAFESKDKNRNEHVDLLKNIKENSTTKCNKNIEKQIPKPQNNELIFLIINY